MQGQQKSQTGIISKEEREKNVASIPLDKKGRMIIRNLQFDLTETHLKKLFGPFGQIIDVKVPLNPSTNQNKGFGFVEFEAKNTAAKAIKALNNSNFKGRKIFVDFSVSQDVYRKIQHNNRQSGQKEVNEKDTLQVNQVPGGLENEKEKEIEMEVEDKQEEEEEKEEEEEVKEEEVKEEEVKEEKKKEIKKNRNDLDGTIFVRNISYEMKEEEFFKFYEKFGSLRYAKIVKQKDTGLSNGTGFLKYNDPIMAETLLEGAEDTSNLLYDLEVNGRTMTLQKALDRNAVTQKEAEENQEGEGLDAKSPNIKKISSLERLVMTDRNGKRNLKLALLGTLQIPQETLQENDKQKRSAHYDEKLMKLKNPNKFISATRILIKGLPKRNFDESDIKAFVSVFQKASYSPKDIKHRKFIKQIQLLKDKEGDTEKTKGIAFVEFISPEDALKFMSYLIVDQHYKSINNKQIPIIEFAIQDIRVINKKLAIFEKKNTHQLQQNQKKKDVDAQKKKTDGVRISQPGEDQATKIIIENIVKNNQLVKEIAKVSDLLKNMKSRGIKQRLKKRITKEFGETIFEDHAKEVNLQKNPKLKKEKVDKVKQALDQYKNLDNVENKKQEKIKKKMKIKVQTEQKQEQKKEQKPEQKKKQPVQQTTDESQILENKELKKISKQIKNLRKNKRREQDHDEFDDIATKYESKIRKKQKWSNTN